MSPSGFLGGVTFLVKFSVAPPGGTMFESDTTFGGLGFLNARKMMGARSGSSVSCASWTIRVSSTSTAERGSANVKMPG